MWVEYVGHHAEVEVDGYGLAVPGVPVDVPDYLAGRAPSGHRTDDDFDPGEGLLAQPVNWRTPTAKAKAAAKADAKAADAAEEG